MLDLNTSVPPLRGEDGGIRSEFVERVAQAIDAGPASQAVRVHEPGRR